MTFPTIPTTGAGKLLTSFDGTVSTTRTSPNLSGLTSPAGELIIAICIGYQSTGTANTIFSGWTNGFTEFYDGSTTTTMATGMAYKWSGGSETGTISVTMAATVTGHAAWIIMSIPGAHASTAPVANLRNVGTTAAALSNSLSPSWGAEDTLWILVGGCGEDAIAGSWTGMGTTTTAGWGTVTNCAVTDTSTVGQTDAAVAFKQVNQATQAGSQQMTGVDVSNARNVIHIVGVRPASGGAMPLAGHADASNSADASTLKLVQPLASHADVSNSAGNSVLGLAQPVTGHADVANGASGSLGFLVPVAGHADASADSSGALRLAQSITGKGDAAAHATGALSLAQPLAGKGDASNFAGGSLRLAQPLAGKGDASNFAGGSMRLAQAISSHADVAASATGDLTLTSSGGPVALAGHADVANGGQGSLRIAQIISGHADAAAYATATLTVTSNVVERPQWRPYAGTGWMGVK